MQFAPTKRSLAQIAPALILAAAVLMPPEVRLTLAGQAFYSYRLAYLLLIPWVLWQAVRKQHAYKLPDMLVLASGLWVIVAFIMVYGVERGLSSGMAVALDSTVPYFVARFSIRSLDDLRRFLVVLAPVVLVLVALFMVEAVTHWRFIREFAQAVFGQLGANEYGETNLPVIQGDTRYGMLRAMGPFSHPILAGTFLVSYLSLMLFSRVRGWPYWAGMTAVIGTLATLSSSPMLGLVLVAFLAFYERFRHLITFLNWPLFVCIVGALIVVLSFISENGLVNVLIRFTLNPQTGYFRLLIWEFGMQSVANYPWFGIGYEPYVRPVWMLTDSVDAFWLYIAMRSGLPAVALLGAGVVWAIFSASRTAGRMRSADAESLIGVIITLVVFVILGFSVSFFGGVLIWFFAVFGITVSLSSLATAPEPRARPKAVRRPVRVIG